MIGRYRKAIAALLGALTPAVVIWALGLVHVHVDEVVAGGICAVLSAASTALVPANNAPKVLSARPSVPTETAVR